MSWKVVKTHLGRAGGPRQRAKRQREWDRRYGEDWAVGYVIDGEFVLRELALESVYRRSYEEHFAQHPDDLRELCELAGSIRNPHAEGTGGVDLQVPAILDILRARGLSLAGSELVDIGSWGGASHAISIRLSPLTIGCALAPKMTLEAFWQKRKCLAVWREE